MKIYLDTCSIQRPLDRQSHIRIGLEAQAVLGILGLVEIGQADLISSDALLFESGRNPLMPRREHALAVLSRAGIFVALTDDIEQRARELIRQGLKILDALNIASAEVAQADYFCTCDDRLLRRARSIPNLGTKVVSPIELIEEIEQWL